MLLSGWWCTWALLLVVVLAKQQPHLSGAPALSLNDALAVLLQEDLYELCAVYIEQPVFEKTRTITVTSTIRRTKTITQSTATTKTISRGKTSTTATATATDTTSSAFATATDYVFDLVTKTRHTKTTVSVTTIYTQTSHPIARRALSTFPPPLPYFTAILSSACTSLLESHTRYKTSTKLATTVTQITVTATSTDRTTIPRKTIVGTSTVTSTTTAPYIAFETTTTTFTTTTTTTTTIYASTTYVPAQCAPTAYVINADEYTDDSENFTRAPEQPDALSCCELCISTANCQAWIWYGDPLFSPPGICVFVTGKRENKCPAPSFNSGFYPICLGQDQNMFSVGLGACTSDINLLSGGCQLGQNQ